MKNILVGIDFKYSSKPLIDMAAKLEERFGSKVWLVHVAAPEPEYVGYSIGPQYIRDDRAHTLKTEHKKLDDFASELHYKHIKAEPLLIQGGAVHMIIDEIDKLGIDLVILGHHKHNVLYKAFVGTIDTEVVKQSKVPTLIVPVLND